MLKEDNSRWLEVLNVHWAELDMGLSSSYRAVRGSSKFPQNEKANPGFTYIFQTADCSISILFYIEEVSVQLKDFPIFIKTIQMCESYQIDKVIDCFSKN